MRLKGEKIEVEVPKDSDELLDYLEFSRYALHQLTHFKNISNKCGYYSKVWDSIFESFGVDISKPINIKSGFGTGDVASIVDDFVEEWIGKYNSLDLSKYDNYTKRILSELTPNPVEIEYLKMDFKKCAQHTTEK